jgi:hypothetical protein
MDMGRLFARMQPNNQEWRYILFGKDIDKDAVFTNHTQNSRGTCSTIGHGPLVDLYEVFLVLIPLMFIKASRTSKSSASCTPPPDQ